MDLPSNIQRLAEIADLIDVQVFAGTRMEIYQPKIASAEELAQEMTKVMQSFAASAAQAEALPRNSSPCRASISSWLSVTAKRHGPMPSAGWIASMLLPRDRAGAYLFIQSTTVKRTNWPMSLAKPSANRQRADEIPRERCKIYIVRQQEG